MQKSLVRIAGAGRPLDPKLILSSAITCTLHTTANMLKQQKIMATQESVPWATSSPSKHRTAYRFFDSTTTKSTTTSSTTSQSERAKMRNQGYKNQGTAGYVYPYKMSKGIPVCPCTDLRPLYRMLYANGNHFYTMTGGVDDKIGGKDGYKYDGVTACLYPK